MESIALAIICKNERHNLPRLIESVSGCFDEIHITDTGSTDGTIEWIKSQPELILHHFDWVDDFSAARNYAFSHPKTQYIMWLDCDDVLVNKQAFIEWKNHTMSSANYWIATYHYGLDDNGNPVCSFMRERVIKNSIGYHWEHFVHEGIPPVNEVEPVKMAYATSWNVKHLRSAQDMEADRNRNLTIFEKNKSKMNPRLEYYYGKELYEAGKYLEAFIQLDKSRQGNLEPHDKVLCLQYCGMAAQQLGQWDKAIEIAHEGLKLVPNRAEFWLMIGDGYLKTQKFDNAIPAYGAATYCINQAPNTATFQTPLFTNATAYEHYPRNQLARVFFHRGELQKAEQILKEAVLLGPNVETAQLYTEIQNLKTVATPAPVSALKKAMEYVITCPQVAMYQWDENIAKTKGIGGSETAAVRMARLLKDKTGHIVRVFMERQDTLDIDGVIYQPVSQARDYFAANAPIAHIAWRHNMKMTEAPTYLWCHDLAVPSVDAHSNYTKVIALSEFHSHYLRHIFNIPEEKILVSRNGIDLERFAGIDFSKKDNDKIVFSSSPDRGLDRAVRVVEQCRKLTGKDLKLHVFYGFENMLKLNLHKEVDRLRSISNKPWIIHHGNVQQQELVNHLKDAKVWLYPTDFLETFCITALEMLACRVRPVVRKHGALQNTLKDLPAAIIDKDCQTAQQVEEWSKILAEQLEVEQPVVDMSRFTWNSVADEWLTWLGK